MDPVIRDVALEGYYHIRRSGNIVCVFMCKLDMDSWLAIILMAHTIYIYIYIYTRYFTLSSPSILISPVANLK